MLWRRWLHRTTRSNARYQLVGNELEPFFVDCARGCDCTGISKEDYRRFYGRWRRVAYKDGRHWCPQCIAQAERSISSTVLPLSNASKKRRNRIAELEAILKERGKPRQATLVNRIPFPELFQHIPQQFDMFGVYVLEASYSRNSHKIPYTEPHHYSGNLENWRKYAKGGAVARCAMGDSRFLSSILGQVEAVVSSPPFGDSLESKDRDFQAKARPGRTNQYADYGQSPGQLGSMPAGEFDEVVDLVVSSPPFGDSLAHKSKADDATNLGISADGSRRGGSFVTGDYGNSDSQLANLSDTGYDLAISSPPYADSMDSQKSGIDASKFKDPHGKTTQALRPTRYGEEDGQLGSMKDDGFDMVVSSSPFVNSLGSDDLDKRGGLLASDPKRRNDANLTGT